MNTVLEKLRQFPGYRLSDSHFRIGSKLHVSDFYFAKRFFQNSYYASRLAFLIAKEILKEPEANEFKTGGITLIGYGLYSELLVSLVERFLKFQIGEKVNHDVVDDADEPQVKRNELTIHKHVAIIVPIASVFSTSMKIEDALLTKDKLKDRFKGKTFLKSHFNILHVYDEHETEDLEDLKASLGWVESGDRCEVVRPFFALQELRNEKYLIRLPSTWYPVDKCSLCFPDDPLSEKPLFVTDKSSVTPDMIFTYPRELTKIQDRKFELKPEHLKHGHLVRGESHFRFYVEIEPFFETNEPAIRMWLKSLRQTMLENYIFDETDRIVIVAPAQFANTIFVNHVNEILFSGAATILHYDARVDDIQNFQTFYADQFEESNDSKTRVFFVDDTITTGRTFLRTNYFIKHSRSHDGESKRQLDGLIVLLDRSSEFVHRNVSRKLEKDTKSFFSFAGLHIPLLRLVNGKCPLCNEHDRYAELAKRSYLDSISHELLLQSEKLEKSQAVEARGYGDEQKSHQVRTDHHLRKVEAMFRVIEWFGTTGNRLSKETTFRDWVQSLNQVQKVPFKTSLSESGGGHLLSEREATILKTITYSQFIHHKPIKVRVFEWLLCLLDEKVRQVETEITKGAFKVRSLRELKLLMRRAGLLNSNFLITPHFFGLLSLMLSEDTVSKAHKDYVTTQAALASEGKEGSTPTFDFNQLEDWTSHLMDFALFYVAQVKELCSVSESRCVRLDQDLGNFLRDQRGNISPRFAQIARFIRHENAIVIENFWDFAKEKLSLDTSETSFTPDFDPFFAELETHKHYRYEILKSFLCKNDQTIRNDAELKSFLALAAFLEKERSLTKLGLEAKMRLIIDSLREIIGNHKNGGAFFLIRYRNPAGDGSGESEPSKLRESAQRETFNANDHFIAYDRSDSGPVGSDAIFNGGQAFLVEFLEGRQLSNDDGNGNPRHIATLIELFRGEDGWVDAYSAGREPVAIQKEFLSEYNRMLLIRFAGTKKPQGDSSDEKPAMAVFYFKDERADRNTPAPLGTNKIRYLLLLRKMIIRFISDHINAEFRDWIEVDIKQRLSLLTGHGREMLLAVAAKHENYRDIIATILIGQRLTLDLADEKMFYLDAGLNSPRSISKIFKQIFEPRENKLGKDDFKKLLHIGDDIFRYKEIENEESVQIRPLECETDLCISYPKEILRMICFELFVNAKKNRWIFLDGEKVKANGTEYDKNAIEMTVAEQDGALTITIVNTGPKVDERVMTKLKNNENPKYYESVAGIELIIKLLKEFGLGKIDFDQKNYDGGFSKFIAILKLIPWNGTNDKNSGDR